jgi:hypothetical protein
MKVNASDIRKVIREDPDADDSYADQEGFEEERIAINEGRLQAYGVMAAINITSITRHGEISYVIDTPGVWGVFIDSLKDPHLDELFEEEKSILIDILNGLDIEVDMGK